MLRSTLRARVRDLEARLVIAEERAQETADDCHVLHDALSAAFQAAALDEPDGLGQLRRHLYVVGSARAHR